MNEIIETAVNIVAEATRIEGKITFDQVARVHGVIVGEVEGLPGSTIILGETALVEGNIRADTLIVDGYVKGNIQASKKVVVSSTGRVIGDIHSPALQVQFGAYFEGNSAMESVTIDPITSGPSLRPA